MPLFSVTVREHAYTGSFYSDVVEAETAREALAVAAARAALRQVSGPLAGTAVPPPAHPEPAEGGVVPPVAAPGPAVPQDGAGAAAGYRETASPGGAGATPPEARGGEPAGAPAEAAGDAAPEACEEAPTVLTGQVTAPEGQVPVPPEAPEEISSAPVGQVPVPPEVPEETSPAPVGQVPVPPTPAPPRGFSVVVRAQAGAAPLYSDTVQAGSATEALEAAAAQAAAPQSAGPETWADPEGRPRCPDAWIYSLLHCERPAGHESPHQATARGYGRLVQWVRDARGVAHAVPQSPVRARAVPPASPQPLADGSFGSG